jgi:hypothetical protein
MYVLRPHVANWQLVRNLGSFQRGYRSVYRLKVIDQWGDALPEQVPIRREVTSAAFPDTTTNWQPDPKGGDLLDGAFNEAIEGRAGAGSQPKAVAPCANPSACQERVMHYCGYLSVGSEERGKGVMIATMAWQHYKDHGRLCNVVSPTASLIPGGTVPCPAPPNSAKCPSN